MRLTQWQFRKHAKGKKVQGLIGEKRSLDLEVAAQYERHDALRKNRKTGQL